MSDYKEIWRKAQEVLREKLGKAPRSANVTKVASKLKKGNMEGARAVLSTIVEASTAGAAAGKAAVASAAVNAAGGTTSAMANAHFVKAKANLTRRFKDSGATGKPKASLIHKLAALRRHNKNNANVMKMVNMELAKATAASAASAADKAASAANAKAAKVKKAAKTVKKAKTPAAAVNNLAALFNVAKPNSATRGERQPLLKNNRTRRNYGATKNVMRPGKKYEDLEAFLANSNKSA